MSMHMRILTDQHQYSRPGTLLTTSQVHISTASNYFTSAQVILFGDTRMCSKNRCSLHFFRTTSEILLTPLWPFSCFMSSSSSKALSMWSVETWGVGETKTQVSSSQYFVHPWLLAFFSQQMSSLMSSVKSWRHARHCGVPAKTIKLWWLRPLYWPTVIDT